MPEEPRGVSPGHEHYEPLCALAAGGLLEGDESIDFKAHLKKCIQCRSDYEALSMLVTRELPQGQGALRERVAEMRAKPLPDSRKRFLRRARAEGVDFSAQVDTPRRSGAWYFVPTSVLGPAAALLLVAIGLAVYRFREVPGTPAGGPSLAQQVAELKRQNAALTSSLSQSNQWLETRQREIQSLRAELAEASTVAESLRRNAEQVRSEAVRSSSQNAQLLDESRNQEKLLAQARDEAARSGQLRVESEAAMVEQQTRITELTDKLRIASATLDMERQLVAAGQDVRELLAARELHIIDVRDTDPNGKPSNAFGRVFLTEGKSLTFYAFDLNQERQVDSKHGFQVWAADSGKNSSRSLGFLHADAKAPGRWVLKVNSPELVKQINALFVTAEPVAGEKEPGGQKMLYAYLGEANRP